MLDFRLLNSLLHNAPDFGVYQIKVWTIRLFALSLASVRLCDL